MARLLDELRFFAGAARVLEGRSAGEYLRGHASYVRREPIGVCAQITPCNYPTGTPGGRWSQSMSPIADATGAVWINTHLPFVSEMPHGGFGHSGHGKDLSMYGFEEYTRVKPVMSHRG